MSCVEAECHSRSLSRANVHTQEADIGRKGSRTQNVSLRVHPSNLMKVHLLMFLMPYEMAPTTCTKTIHI